MATADHQPACLSSVTINQFKAADWSDQELHAYNYSFMTSNASVAQDIKEQVSNIIKTTGAHKVMLLLFSMGSISSRYYLKNLGGTSVVDARVSLSGLYHGTSIADQCSLAPLQEIQLNSSFLKELNARDETPGSTRYGTWWSPCDETIDPPESTILEGQLITNPPATAIARCPKSLGFI